MPLLHDPRHTSTPNPSVLVASNVTWLLLLPLMDTWQLSQPETIDEAAVNCAHVAVIEYWLTLWLNDGVAAASPMSSCTFTVHDVKPGPTALQHKTHHNHSTLTAPASYHW